MLPRWADFLPEETRAAARLADDCLTPNLYLRLSTLAAMPGLSLRQKATLAHRSHNWLGRFRAPTHAPVKPSVTFEQARSLFHAVGWNGISSPFLLDQMAKGITPEQAAAAWQIPLPQARAAMKRTHSTWWTLHT